MIPDVAREAILDAISLFDRDLRKRPEWTKWEENESHKYAIELESKRYPVKKIVSLATGTNVASFHGGNEANSYVSSRGFTVTALREGANDTIQNCLTAILDGYVAARENDDFGRSHSLWQVSKELQRELQASDPVSGRPTLRVKASLGQGEWAAIPWVSFLDSRETSTTQQGVYCVFLFREDMSGVYATFNQGVTKPKQQLGWAKAERQLREKAVGIRRHSQSLGDAGFNLDDKVDLRASLRLGAEYEASTIAYKLYPKGGVPGDEEILEDVEALLRTYDLYLNRTADPDVSGLENMKARFLERMPGFTSFRQKSGQYWLQEREYKEELRQVFNEEISRDLFPDVIDDQSATSVIEHVKAVLTRRIPSTGEPQNLLHWRYVDFLKKLEPGSRKTLAQAIGDLLYGAGDSAERVERFNHVFEPILKRSRPGGTSSYTRGLPTFLLMLSDPASDIYIKTGVFKRTAKLLGLTLFDSGSLNAEQYSRVLTMAEIIRAATERWGWQPADQIDVQSFIWVALSPSYGPVTRAWVFQGNPDYYNVMARLTRWPK